MTDVAAPPCATLAARRGRAHALVVVRRHGRQRRWTRCRCRCRSWSKGQAALAKSGARRTDRRGDRVLRQDGHERPSSCLLSLSCGVWELETRPAAKASVQVFVGTPSVAVPRPIAVTATLGSRGLCVEMRVWYRWESKVECRPRKESASRGDPRRCRAPSKPWPRALKRSAPGRRALRKVSQASVWSPFTQAGDADVPHLAGHAERF